MYKSPPRDSWYIDTPVKYFVRKSSSLLLIHWHRGPTVHYMKVLLRTPGTSRLSTACCMKVLLMTPGTLTSKYSRLYESAPHNSWYIDTRVQQVERKSWNLYVDTWIQYVEWKFFASLLVQNINQFFRLFLDQASLERRYFLKEKKTRKQKTGIALTFQCTLTNLFLIPHIT